MAQAIAQRCEEAKGSGHNSDCPARSPPDHQQHHLRRLCAERDAHAEFPTALRDLHGEQAVHTDEVKGFQSATYYARALGHWNMGHKKKENREQRAKAGTADTAA